jgi:hypothetical protein
VNSGPLLAATSKHDLLAIALAAVVAGEVEHVPYGGHRQERPGEDLRPVLFVKERLLLLGLEGRGAVGSRLDDGLPVVGRVSVFGTVANVSGAACPLSRLQASGRNHPPP